MLKFQLFASFKSCHEGELQSLSSREKEMDTER